MKTIIKISILLFLFSCGHHDITPKQYTNVFRYFDKKTNDTIKFYGFKNLDTAIKYAKTENKNILAVFSGWACMSVHGLEWKTLCLYSDPEKIQNNFIIAWLPVDDRTPLPDTTQSQKLFGKTYEIKTVGDQNLVFQIATFKNNSQPLMCFLNQNKKPFGKTMTYNKDKNIVEDFVNSGLIK